MIGGLFVCLFDCLLACLFVCLLACLFVCLFVWLFFGCLFVWLLHRSDDSNKMAICLLQRPIWSFWVSSLNRFTQMSILAWILGPFSHTPFACSLFLTFLSSVSDVFHPWQMGIRDPTLTRWIKVWRIYVHWDKQCCVSLLPVAFLGLNGLKALQTLFWGQGYLEYLVNKLRFLQGKRPSWCLWHCPSVGFIIDTFISTSCKICVIPGYVSDHFQIYTFFCLRLFFSHYRGKSALNHHLVDILNFF